MGNASVFLPGGAWTSAFRGRVCDQALGKASAHTFDDCRAFAWPKQLCVGSGVHGEVDVNDTLESMIARSGGDTSHAYIVKDGEQTVGTLDMTELVRALVPRVAPEAGTRQS